MTNLKIFQKLFTKLDPPSAQDEMKGQKQSTPLVDQGETPLSEKAPDSLVERDPEEYGDSGYAPSKTTEVYRLVEREFLSPDFRHRNAHEDVDFDEFEEDAVADMILVGRVCEHFSRHLHLSTEERLRAEFVSRMKWLSLTKASSQTKIDAEKENFMWHNLNTAFKIRQLEDANRGGSDGHKQSDLEAEKGATGLLDGSETVSSSRKAFIPQLDSKMDVHGCSENLAIQDLRLRLYPPTVPKKKPVGLDVMAFLGPPITPTKLLIRVVKGTILFKFVAKKSNELSVSSGERVWFLAHYETVWLLAMSSEGQIGLVPASFVEISNHCKGSEISTRFDLAPVETWNRKKWYWVIHCCMEDFEESETKGSVCPTDRDLPARDESEDGAIHSKRSSCSSMVPLFSNDNDWSETSKAETEQVDCVDPNLGHEENHTKMESTNILFRFCGIVQRREKKDKERKDKDRKDKEGHSGDTVKKERSTHPPRGDPDRRQRVFWRGKWFSSNRKIIRQKAFRVNGNDLHKPNESHTDRSPDEKVKPETLKCNLTHTSQPKETQLNRGFKGFVKRFNILKLGGKRSSAKDTLVGPEVPFERAPEAYNPTNHEAAQVGRGIMKQIDRIGTEKTETEKHQVTPV